MVKHAENSYLNFMRNNPELFPWGSDDDDEDEDCSRSPPGLVMDPASSTTQEAQNFGDGSICYKLPTTSLLAGRVLHHCETVIQKLRMQTGGLQLVIFKIGITHECSISDSSCTKRKVGTAWLSCTRVMSSEQSKCLKLL